MVGCQLTYFMHQLGVTLITPLALFWINLRRLVNYLGYACDDDSFKENTSLDPRPIRLQLNARSPPRPGIDFVSGHVLWLLRYSLKTSEYLSKVEQIETLIVYVSILTP